MFACTFYLTPAAVAQFLLTADILHANVALEGSQNANCSLFQISSAGNLIKVKEDEYCSWNEMSSRQSRWR